MIGQTISHYKILEKLGEGGMGIVYKAQDLKLDRLVALKFLPQNITPTEAEKTRFIHEAKAASGLDHPNICNIHEIDETPDGQVFIAMAFYEGATLNKKVERGPLKLNEAIDIAIQIAEGLHPAHKKGIVHRDIKSGNIMITEEGQVKIVDFGLARTTGLTRLTKTGATIGTVPYMSPEQARGDKVDHRTDVWSLGVVLYEMLTGQLPFKGDYEQAIAYQITNVTPEPVTGLRSGIPLELERVVNKCLEKNADERYQTAADLIADLRHFQRKISQQVTLSASTAKQPARKVSRRYWLAAAMSVIVLGAFLIIFVKPFSRESERERKSIAVLPFNNLSDSKDDEYFADGLTEDVITQVSKIQGFSKVIARTSVMQYKHTDKDVKDIGKELDVASILEGSVRRAGNKIRVVAQLIDASNGGHIWADTYDKEIRDIFAIQSDVAQQIAAALKVKLTPKEKEYIEKKPTENTEAYNYYLKGREYYYRYKKQDNEEAIKLFKKAISIDPDFALAWAGLGDAYGQRPPRYGFSYSWLDSAMTVSKKAIELDNSSAEAHKALGLVYYWEGYIDSSLRAYTRAIELNPNYFPAIGNIGDGYLYIGELGQSLPWLHKSILMAPMIPGVFASLGEVYRLVGEYGKAEQYLRKASDLQFDELITVSNVTRFYLSQGKNREANELMKRVSTSNSDNPTFLEWAGYIAAMTGDLTKAREYYQRSLSIRASIETVNDSSGGTMLAYIYMKEGKRIQAEKILTKQMIIAKENIKRGVQGGGTEYTLTCVSAIQGKNREAYTYLEKAIERGQRDYQLAVRDPRFENIRNDEEFKKLIAHMKSKVDEQRRLIEEMEKVENQ